ncbi:MULTISPECIES: transposase [Paraburkholderia]|uniref:transposase n=1 Tax=Paraburkholderia TaxID=1822464 RepID=UPI0038BB06D6
MNTVEEDTPVGRRRRWRYSAEFKAQLVAACRRPGVSLTAIALDHRLNANLRRRWVKQAGKIAQSRTRLNMRKHSIFCHTRMTGSSVIAQASHPHESSGAGRIHRLKCETVSRDAKESPCSDTGAL